MKKIYFLALTIVIVLTSCNQKGKQNEAESQVKQSDSTGQTSPTIQADDTALYSCSMHPEVHGKKDSECPKCGMNLTEPVSKE